MPLIMFVSSSFNTYVNLPKKKDMVYLATKVERQLKKGHVRPTFNSGSSSSWKPNLRRDGNVDQPRNSSNDPLHVPNGPMTRSKTKALNALVLKV